MSQADLGQMIGKDRSAVSRMENNIMKLDAGMIVRLSEIFQCSSDYLLGLTDERVPKRSM